jgi:expansin (peptidoglycan-binding protein)
MPTTTGPSASAAGPTPAAMPEPDMAPEPGVEPVAQVDPALIDDLEDGDALIVPQQGRSGRWTTYNDGTGQQTPAQGAIADPESGGANGSAYAMHTTGSGFTDWGAGLQVDLNNSTDGAGSGRAAFDASAYDGIRFWARGSGLVRVELSTRATATTDEGGTCSDNCLDNHGQEITLADSWTEYSVSFSTVVQQGWGLAADFSAADLLAIAFRVNVPDSANFDIWVDDLGFYTGDATVEPGPEPSVGPQPVMEPVPEPQPVPEPESIAGTCADQGGYDNGSVTYYTFDQGTVTPNCSYEITNRNPDTVAHIATGGGQYFGAMNTSDYAAAATCGACVEVTRDGSRKVTVTIVDQCPAGSNPKCKPGHIDLSQAAFQQIGDLGEGYLGTGNGGMYGSISWRYVPCPIDENVSFRLKEPDRTDWNELLVQGHKFPIVSVEVNGQQATRKDYNYWEPPNGDMGPEPFRIRVTDVNGGVVNASVARSNGDMMSNAQFSCQ